jgi:hypothetical protein
MKTTDFVQEMMNHFLKDHALITKAEWRDLQCDRMNFALATSTEEDGAGRAVHSWHPVRRLPDETDADPSVDERGYDSQRTQWTCVSDNTVTKNGLREHLLESLRQRRQHINEDLDSLYADFEFINAKLEANGLEPLDLPTAEPCKFWPGDPADIAEAAAS